MKLVLRIMFLFFSFSPLFAKDTEMQEITFGDNPGNLKMYMHFPNGQIMASKPRPVVVCLHGCFQNSKSLASITDWNRLADRYNFYVLYPDQKTANNSISCFNWFKTEDLTEGSGEIQSIMNMIRFAQSHYNIDSNQVFVYGVSAGAAMTANLMTVFPSAFKAGAVLAGAPYKIATTKTQAMKAKLKSVDKTPSEWSELVPDQSKSQPLPKLIVYHGTRDKTVNIKNAYELIDQWTALHQIDTIADDTKSGFGQKNVDRIAYQDNLGNEKIVFFKIHKLGHAIAIDPGNGVAQGGHAGTFAKKTGFFSTFYLAKEFGLISE